MQAKLLTGRCPLENRLGKLKIDMCLNLMDSREHVACDLGFIAGRKGHLGADFVRAELKRLAAFLVSERGALNERVKITSESDCWGLLTVEGVDKNE